MKKILMVLLMISSISILAAEQDVVIDKEVTGVNKEQLEIYPKDNNVTIESKTEKLNDKNITKDRYKNQKKVISLKEKNTDMDKSLTETEGSNLWKYLLGAAALITLGVAL